MADRVCTGFVRIALSIAFAKPCLTLRAVIADTRRHTHANTYPVHIYIYIYHHIHTSIRLQKSTCPWQQVFAQMIIMCMSSFGQAEFLRMQRFRQAELAHLKLQAEELEAMILEKEEVGDAKTQCFTLLRGRGQQGAAGLCVRCVCVCVCAVLSKLHAKHIINSDGFSDSIISIHFHYSKLTNKKIWFQRYCHSQI